ncbi:MAG: hypothetical protein FJZ01_20760 [Candidatus Sericytochromatia bacterium]|nr:hypothetical protein [Candidatus Tanganyikabacteria bacterium]
MGLRIWSIAAAVAAAAACSQLAAALGPPADTRDYSQCSGGPLGGPDVPPQYANPPFSYEIRPGIEKPGEQAMGLVGHPRGRYPDPPTVGVVFEYDVTEADIAAWLVRRHATVVRRFDWNDPVVPGRPDGRISRSATVSFDDTAIDLADLQKYAELQGYRGPYVFSSKRMAVAFQELLRFRWERCRLQVRNVTWGGGSVGGCIEVEGAQCPTPEPTIPATGSIGG